MNNADASTKKTQEKAPSVKSFQKGDFIKLADVRKFQEKYQVISMIGEGTQGMVFKVVEKETNSMFAMKMVKFNSTNFDAPKN